MEIKLTEIDAKGYATAMDGDKKAGEMTYSIPGNDFIIIDHTEVDPAFGGKGIGKQLLMKIVEMAREKGIKIMPLCPFAAAMFKKLPEIADVKK